MSAIAPILTLYRDCAFMNYRESERKKALRIRDEFFKDPGNGEHLKFKYPFVLERAEKNLWTKIRKEAIKYFADNEIVWWPGSDQPSGHLFCLYL